jgi:hypothetical protein
VANESVPAMKVNIKQKMFLLATCTTGFNQEKELSIYIGGFRYGHTIIYVRLPRKKQNKSFTPTRAENIGI